MSGFAIKGWCPGALRPMLSGDGLLVRLRPRLGRVSSAQAMGIAEVARAHGNGLIDLSARANVQLRGIREERHGELLNALRALDLLDDDLATESHRNMMVTPFWTPEDGTLELAQAMETALRKAPDLPGKFGFAVDTGVLPVLGASAADIRLERGSAGQLWLRPDGTALRKAVTDQTASAEALALAAWFLTTGGARDGRGRMAAHLAGGAILPEGFVAGPLPTPVASPQPGPQVGGTLVGFEFGQITADDLSALAALGDLRVTPWRMLLVEGRHDVPQVAGWITTPGDPRLAVTACTGAPGCPQALQPTRDLARALTGVLPKGQHLHVSGCAKGCAHPGVADVTLTGQLGGFGLIRNGRAVDHVSTFLLQAQDLAAHPSTVLKAP